jgi:hypothetical protein
MVGHLRQEYGLSFPGREQKDEIYREGSKKFMPFLQFENQSLIVSKSDFSCLILKDLASIYSSLDIAQFGIYYQAYVIDVLIKEITVGGYFNGS